MELSIVMRLRIAAAVAVGVVLIGIAGWPLAEPLDPRGVVSITAGSLSINAMMACGVLAVFAGVIAYFLSWPYGREIAPVAVPVGLAVWALRTGNVAGLMQQNRLPGQQRELFAGFAAEASLWVIIVLAGLLGVFIAQKLIPVEKREKDETACPKRRVKTQVIAALIAIVGSVLVGQFCIRLFAQDIRLFEANLGLIGAQPAVGQIVFAVAVAFGIVAFTARKLLGTGYVWSIIATGLVGPFVVFTYARGTMLESLSQRAAAVFFIHPGLAVLPVQMVAFGSLGAMWGYWLAVRFDYWREHG